MSSIENRTILKLAASELTPNEIRAFLKMVERLGQFAVSRQIERLRDLPLLEDRVSSPLRHGPSDAARLRNFDEIIDKVETLLVGDAGLAKSMAGTLLYNELSRRGRFGDLPIPTKIAFRLWLARLLDTVPQSEVLHAATKIRNGLVHGSETGSDWPLISKD